MKYEQAAHGRWQVYRQPCMHACMHACMNICRGFCLPSRIGMRALPTPQPTSTRRGAAAAAAAGELLLLPFACVLLLQSAAISGISLASQALSLKKWSVLRWSKETEKTKKNA